MSSTSEKGAAAQVSTPFVVKDLHKKALLTLLHCFHNNRQSLTYAELSLRMGTSEKTKAWQCVAWKDLKNDYIVPLADKKYELSSKGVELASSLASDEELAEFKTPETTEELHEKIKAKLERIPKAKGYGAKILDLMAAPEYIPLNRNEIAAKFNVFADSHGFFYGLKALKDMGYVVFCSSEEIADLKASIAATPKLETSVAVVDEVKTGADQDVDVDGEKKRALDESGDSNELPKKKKYKSTKKREGGKPLKLSDVAFIQRPLVSAVVTPSK